MCKYLISDLLTKIAYLIYHSSTNIFKRQNSFKSCFWKEPSYISGGNINWYSHYGKRYGVSSKKLRIELPYDPEIPFLGIYPQILKHICKDIRTPKFIATLFTVAETGRQPVFFEEWLDGEDEVHIYSEILLSHKKRWNSASSDTIDGSWEYHAVK